jgi:hypothetical protein
MSKLTVAQLIGETPEMLRACGEVIKYEHLAHYYAEKAFGDIRFDANSNYCRSMLESARENVARMVAVK